MLSTADYLRLRDSPSGGPLVALMVDSPLGDVTMEHPKITGPGRGVVNGWLLDTNLLAELRRTQPLAGSRSVSSSNPATRATYSGPHFQDSSLSYALS